jgi:hypothetical protein
MLGVVSDAPTCLLVRIVGLGQTSIPEHVINQAVPPIPINGGIPFEDLAGETPEMIEGTLCTLA